MKHVVIIGAGLGGLATALRLNQHGVAITVLEKQAQPGGRCNVLQEQGFRADTGPTILVMKETFEETYRALGLDLHARLNFVPLDPNYRIYFHDGRTLDLYGQMSKLAAEVERFEPGASTRLFHFLGASARKYELGMDFVTRNYDHITDLVNFQAALRLAQTGAYQNLYGQVGHFFQTPELRQAFSFHSMFLGLSPFNALAMYSLITYADLTMGMYFPLGGIYSIIEDMVQLAHTRGVTLRTNAPVQKILVENKRACGVQLASGETITADAVISNADLPYTYLHLLDTQPHRMRKRLANLKYACSGYILFLGVRETYPHMRHQALYFAQDYRGNLEAIFKTRTVPSEISFHLNNPTRTDPTLAPAGHSLLYVLAPMPNLQGPVDWTQVAPLVREHLVAQLEKLVDPALRSKIVWERAYTPLDWQRDINAMHGTAFGSVAHHFFQSAYFRPHNIAREIAGLYFVGQGTYPGIGMPMVLISARLVTERIMHDWHT
jgi:phytoene desaturase